MSVRNLDQAQWLKPIISATQETEDESLRAAQAKG
jgi:hypothetical protein